MTLIHASCVAIAGRGVLISGPSGAGKSDLALRLIDRGAVLVSDDQVVLSAVQGRLHAAAPASIAGKIEVRGLGIVAMSHHEPVPVALLIQLSDAVERMPEDQSRTLCGLDVPMVLLDPFTASAPIKAELALAARGLPA
jgi:serine kinase of HPr protein (carbohydrate metabolism regulator)